MRSRSLRCCISRRGRSSPFLSSALWDAHEDPRRRSLSFGFSNPASNLTPPTVGPRKEQTTASRFSQPPIFPMLHAFSIWLTEVRFGLTFSTSPPKGLAKSPFQIWMLLEEYVGGGGFSFSGTSVDEDHARKGFRRLSGSCLGLHPPSRRAGRDRTTSGF